MKFVFAQKHGRRSPASGLCWHTATVWLVTSDLSLEEVGTYKDQYKFGPTEIRRALVRDGVIADQADAVLADFQELVI